MDARNRSQVVIVGAGFGGLYAARALERAPVRVIVIDRRNHHLFQPLLYQVATAALNPADIAAPTRRVLRPQKNAEVLLADVMAIEPARRRVVLADGEVAYDHRILATGATHSYFGHPEWAVHAPGLKKIHVIGDLAALKEKDRLVPGVAPAAIQEGRHAAENVMRAIRGELQLPFHYRDKGILATIGRGAAVARIGRAKLSGAIAWFAWLLVHIMFLIGFRNRFAVVLEWAWSYLTFERGARLITETAEQWKLLGGVGGARPPHASEVTPPGGATTQPQRLSEAVPPRIH